MKKSFLYIFSFLFIIVFLASALSGCSRPGAASTKLRIVATIFPEYDWVRALTDGSDAFELKLLYDNGADLHSYQPTAGDIASINECDLFIYVGGESDESIERILANLSNEELRTVKLLDVLGSGAKPEEHFSHDEHEDEHEDEPDEHVWLSLRNAKLFCEKIAEKLIELDPGGKAIYERNLDAYTEKLAALDAEYASAVADAKFHTLLVADRFPFRYLADDYGLEYFAAFSGCSAETEASFETIAFLANKLNELELPCLIETETARGGIARTVRDASGRVELPILKLDSMQSRAAADASASNGASYLDIMRSNLAVLKDALK